MTEKILEIEIYGQRYKIRVKGDEDEKYIGHLTSLVDQKMHEVAVKSKSADTTKIAVLAALNIADELFLSQKKLDQLNDVLGHMETEIESLEVHLFADENTYTDVEKSAFVTGRPARGRLAGRADPGLRPGRLTPPRFPRVSSFK